MKISAFLKKLADTDSGDRYHVSANTIRRWEKVGLLKFDRSWNGDRIFTEKDVQTVKDFIKENRGSSRTEKQESNNEKK